MNQEMTYPLIIFLLCDSQEIVRFSRTIKLPQRPVIGRITGPFRVEQEVGENTSYAQSLQVSPENRESVIAEFQRKGWVQV